jgi:ribosome biogenesis GTPase
MWSADGLDETFSEISALAERCKFRDCLHDTEPACKVREAIEAGTLDESRLLAWRKLLREARRVETQAHLRNAESRRRARAIRQHLREKRR